MPTAEPAPQDCPYRSDVRLRGSTSLGRAEGTRFADYSVDFVQRLVAHAEQALERRPSPEQRAVLELVFDNTRRARARILREARDPAQVRALITGFWSYQLPGLDGLMSFIRLDDR
jgi:hypothetical protein